MYDIIKLLSSVSAVGEALAESYSGGGTRLSNGSMFQRKLANKRLFMFARADTRRVVYSGCKAIVSVHHDMRPLNK